MLELLQEGVPDQPTPAQTWEDEPTRPRDRSRSRDGESSSFTTTMVAEPLAGLREHYYLPGSGDLVVLFELDVHYLDIDGYKLFFLDVSYLFVFCDLVVHYLDNDQRDVFLLVVDGLDFNDYDLFLFFLRCEC